MWEPRFDPWLRKIPQTALCHKKKKKKNKVTSHCSDFNTPWKEFRIEIRKEALCAQRKTGRTGLLRVRYFTRFSESNFLHLLIFRKALKLLRETSAP